MSVFHMADIVYSQLPHRKLFENLNSSCWILFRTLQPDGTPDSWPTTAVVSDGVPRFSSNQSVRTDPAQTHNTCPTLTPARHSADTNNSISSKSSHYQGLVKTLVKQISVNIHQTENIGWRNSGLGVYKHRDVDTSTLWSATILRNITSYLPDHTSILSNCGRGQVYIQLTRSDLMDFNFNRLNQTVSVIISNHHHIKFT